jgi:6-phospho-3-hexuloisomerase
MHLGRPVYVVGETTTPSIAAEDLLIVGSRSGETAGLLTVAQKARGQGAGLLLFSAQETSSLANLADHCLIIPALPADDAGDERGQTSLQPMGSLFEQSLFILCDTLILELMARSSVSASQMLERHANLE